MTLLNIPGFIERLCKLATRKVSEATGANFLQELEDWYTWLDNALVLDALMQMATEEAEQSSTGEAAVTCTTGSSQCLNPLNFNWEIFFPSPSESSDESSLATSPLRHRLPQSMKIVHEIMYKVEVLYVLCVLLMGRQRNQVHDGTHISPPGHLSCSVLLTNTDSCNLSLHRFTRCWLSSVSSRGSTTCSTSWSGGNTLLQITWCMARMRTATVVQYDVLTLFL